MVVHRRAIIIRWSWNCQDATRVCTADHPLPSTHHPLCPHGRLLMEKLVHCHARKLNTRGVESLLEDCNYQARREAISSGLETSILVAQTSIWSSLRELKSLKQTDTLLLTGENDQFSARKKLNIFNRSLKL